MVDAGAHSTAELAREVAALRGIVERHERELASLRWMLEPPPPVADPFFAWIERNPETVRALAGKQVAFHPTRGVLASGDTLDDVWRELGELASLPDLVLAVMPRDVVEPR